MIRIAIINGVRKKSRPFWIYKKLSLKLDTLIFSTQDFEINIRLTHLFQGASKGINTLYPAAVAIGWLSRLCTYHCPS
jgi:hypothetical protein